MGNGEHGRRGWPTVAVIGTTVVLVCVAVVFGVLGTLARVDAGDASTRNDRLAGELRRLVRGEEAHAAQLQRLVGGAGVTSGAMAAFVAAVRAQADASNHAVSVLNHAADLFNTGHQSDAGALLQGDGTTALADLESKTTAVNNAYIALRDDVTDLEVGAGG
jgi:hypothetical protein